MTRTSQEIFQELRDVQNWRGTLLTDEELAVLLDIPIQENGMFNGVDMFNACWEVQNNPKVLALQGDERLRAIRSATVMMGRLQFGN